MYEGCKEQGSYVRSSSVRERKQGLKKLMRLISGLKFLLLTFLTEMLFSPKKGVGVWDYSSGCWKEGGGKEMGSFLKVW